MKVLVTGAFGFIGKNLCSHLELLDDVEILSYGRKNSPQDLDNFVKNADFIFHIAGVNRPKDEGDFMLHNVELTQRIIDILRANNKHTPLLITSSIQADADNPYGKSKLSAENSVLDWHKESDSPVYIYRLPGVFGKWCKPNYNSVVATFCYNIANKLPIQIADPSHTITLAYIDDVVNDFISHLYDTSKSSSDFQNISRTFQVTLGDLSHRIQALHDIRTHLIIPDLSDLLNKFLYATYVSYLNKDEFSYELTKKTDQRGSLAEFVKSYHFGQIFVSRTKPGFSRGDHWHKTKIEKFFVVEGKAEVTFRNKTAEQDIITYTVKGSDMQVVDIPVGYIHAIKNIGNSDLITLFWANEIHNPDSPDTFYEKVILDE